MKNEHFNFYADISDPAITDITDEDLDKKLKEHFPNRTIAGMDKSAIVYIRWCKNYFYYFFFDEDCY